MWDRCLRRLKCRQLFYLWLRTLERETQQLNTFIGIKRLVRANFVGDNIIMLNDNDWLFCHFCGRVSVFFFLLVHQRII